MLRVLIIIAVLVHHFQEVCKHLQADATGYGLVSNIASAANVYANYTGKTKCLDINQQATGNLGDQGWDFQVSLCLFTWFIVHLGLVLLLF